MLERSFVLFKTLAEGKPVVSNRQYLVATKDFDGEANFVIAYWYDKGDTVRLDYKPEAAPEPSTMEERLLRAIFGGPTKDVTVETDGFYIVTSDYGISDENADCMNDLFFVNGDYDNTDVSWAELPFAPKGTVHPYDMQDKRARERARLAEEKREEYIEKLETYITNSPSLQSFGGFDVYKNIAKREREGGAANVISRGLVIGFDYVDYLESLAAAACIIEAGDLLYGNYSPEFIAQAAEDWVERHDGSKYDEMHNFVYENIFKTNDLFLAYGKRASDFRKIVLVLIRMLYMSTKDQLDDDNFHFYLSERHLRKIIGEHLIEKFENMKIVSVFVARCTLSISMREMRYRRLLDIEAPAVILYNEFRVLAEYIRYLFQPIVKAATASDAINIIGTNDADYGGHYDFGSYYGVTTDAKNAVYAPPCDDGNVYREDRNGVRTVPYKGIDADGNEEFYSEYDCNWDPEDTTFVKRGIEYSITDWHNFIDRFALVHIERIPDTGKYRVPDVGITVDGTKAVFDANRFQWDVGSDAFVKIPESETDNDQKLYKIESYREFDEPEAYIAN